MCGPRWNRYRTPSIASHLLLICGACLCLLCECGVSNVVVCVNLGRAKCARRWRWRWWWHIGRGKNIFPIMKRKFDRRCDAIRTRNWNKMKKIAFVTMDTCSIYLTIHCFFSLMVMVVVVWWWFGMYAQCTYIECICGGDGGAGANDGNQYHWPEQNFKLLSIVNVI